VTYAPAYFTGECKREKKKSFIVLTPGVNIIKLFSFVTDDEAQEASVFALGNPCQSGFRI
jgi:hypothetical protein